jgi:hypothetical protein
VISVAVLSKKEHIFSLSLSYEGAGVKGRDQMLLIWFRYIATPAEFAMGIPRLKQNRFLRTAILQALPLVKL